MHSNKLGSNADSVSWNSLRPHSGVRPVPTAHLKPVRVLLGEDCRDDARSIVRALEAGGFELDCVQTSSWTALVALLENSEWDVVVCSDSLPEFVPAEVLHTMTRIGRDAPFIVVSRNDSAVAAAAAMREGASDFILKSHLAHLGPSLRRELYGVNEQRRTTDALEQTRARLRLVLEQFPLVMWSVDANLSKTWSAGGTALLRTAASGSNEEFASELLVPIRTHHLVAAAEMHGLNGEASSVDIELGDRVYAVSVKPNYSQGRIAGLVGVAFDVTQRRDLEKQLRAAQRMETIGLLAGGIAHDFSNVLSVINSYSDFIMEDLEEEAPARADVQVIKDASRRAGTLVAQLLAFGRRQVLQPIVLNANNVIQDLRSMLARILGEDIRLVVRLSPSPAYVKADPGQLDQVLLNLVVNARDAMPEGGVLTLSTDHVAGPEAETSNPRVRLSITDTGKGMSADVRERIFEPFFTTKPAGRGTGLGLSTVYGIVKQSGGDIHVASEPGAGARFDVFLPAAREQPEQLAPRSAPPKPVGGLSKVLLAEDDDLVRSAAARVLSQAGYSVLVAACAEEAREIHRRCANEIGVLLTDVVMPDASGIALADFLRAQNPRLRVVLMSGYTPDKRGQQEWPQDVAFIHKPIDPAALAQTVGDLLTQCAAERHP